MYRTFSHCSRSSGAHFHIVGCITFLRGRQYAGIHQQQILAGHLRRSSGEITPSVGEHRRSGAAHWSFCVADHVGCGGVRRVCGAGHGVGTRSRRSDRRHRRVQYGVRRSAGGIREIAGRTRCPSRRRRRPRRHSTTTSPVGGAYPPVFAEICRPDGALLFFGGRVLRRFRASGALS